MGFSNFTDKFNNNNRQEDKRGFVDEDEWLVIQNDPEFKKALEYSLDKKTDSDNFDQWITSDKTWDSYMRVPFDEYEESQISEENLPFDEQDITKTWKASTKEPGENTSLETKSEPVGDVSFDEFVFMHGCAKYIHEFFDKNNANAPRPTFADGSIMTIDQIRDQATEYKNLLEENPEEFYDLQSKMYGWEKKALNWKFNTHKGKDSWFAQIGSTYFVSSKNPDNFYHSKNGSVYLKQTGSFKPQNKNVETIFVEPQVPLQK